MMIMAVATSAIDTRFAISIGSASHVITYQRRKAPTSSPQAGEMPVLGRYRLLTRFLSAS